MHRLRLLALLGLAVGLLAFGASQGAGAGSPFTTTLLPNSNGFSEPREAITNSGQFWIESNASDNSAAVWGSNSGLQWTQTPTEPAGQTDASTDVDIVTTPSGRIVETQLDFGGINFRTAYSDEG